MNKALAVLKTLKQAIELSHFNNSGVTFGKDTIAEINEATAEVENLIAHKQTHSECEARYDKLMTDYELLYDVYEANKAKDS